MFLILAVVGFIPFEVIAPAATFLIKGLLYAALIASLWAAVYTLGWIWSVYTILHISGGREWLESGKVGHWIVRYLGHKRVNNHLGWKRIRYEIRYHLIIYLFGLSPFLMKIGVARCVLYPRPLAIIALIAGTTTRAFLLVYLAIDLKEEILQLFKWGLSFFGM
ncbi:hypothetical protein ACFL0L_02985 [Patescibacteria group bacterium]